MAKFFGLSNAGTKFAHLAIHEINLYICGDMELRKEYLKPALRIAEVRFEYALLQTSGSDRADDGYDPGIDLGELD